MPQDWQTQLRESISNPAELLSALELPSSIGKTSTHENFKFPLKVTHSFLGRMEKNNLHDPLLLQVLPVLVENDEHPGYTHDPVGEQTLVSTDSPGLLHKYAGRVLLITTGACAIHCRYCFRREYPYQDQHAGKINWEPALTYIKKDNSINEVILSGGDPLMLSDDKLNILFNKIKTIPHIKRIRIHTRIPVVLPDRITDELVRELQNTDLNLVIVIHSNHPNEIDEEVGEKLNVLRRAGFLVLNQSVLLKNINDDVAILINLNEKLFEYGVLPYYLHLLDKVTGSAHFDVAEETASEIMHDLRCQLPGYLVPRLVREQAGKPYKIPVL